MKPSFTILELIIVIIIIALLSFTITINIPNDKLQLASDSIKRYLNYTHSLALKDDKFIAIPENNSSVELNKSKYWFKRFWQFKIGKTTNNIYFIQVYYDSDLIGSISVNDYAKDPLTNKYINGNYYAPSSDPDANLSHFNITNIIYKYKNQQYNITSNNPLHIYFDNFGNVYLFRNNNNDTNIFKNMEILNSNLEINIYQNTSIKKIIITPTGYVY